jgi:hypothetical protein
VKNLLIISYYFPPSGGPGVQRVLKFVKYLREFDVRPVVLTVADGDYPARDESLLAEIPADVKVYRTKIFEPYDIYRTLTGKPKGSAVDVNNIPKAGDKKSAAETVANFIRSNFFIPDARVGWLPYGVKAGLQIIRDEKINCLYSSSPPYTTSLIARSLKKKTGVNWIAGFRDPWTGFLSTPVRYGLAKKIDTHLERSVFAECDAFEVAWNGILADFSAKYPDVDTAKAIHIENGFDDADIPNVQFPRNEKFTVCYTGSMYGKRNPKSFLQAVRELVAEKKVDAAKINLKFVGRFGADVMEMFQDEALKNSIEVKGYIPHGESILELLKSDALLLIVDDTADSSQIVPGKVYEYIGTKRPVITLALDGAISRLITETRAGSVANFRNVAEIKAVFEKYYAAFCNGQKLYDPDDNEIKKYTRREAARKLAGVIHQL